MFNLYTYQIGRLAYIEAACLVLYIETACLFPFSRRVEWQGAQFRSEADRAAATDGAAAGQGQHGHGGDCQVCRCIFWRSRIFHCGTVCLKKKTNLI